MEISLEALLPSASASTRELRRAYVLLNSQFYDDDDSDCMMMALMIMMVCVRPCVCGVCSVCACVACAVYMCT